MSDSAANPASDSRHGRDVCDVCVLGGGIAGLWLSVHMAMQGRRVTLIGRTALGDGQTIASQGIIHGGVKYALSGAASAASRAIARMPEVWAACIAGHGPVDLRGVRVLSDRQWMWSTGSVLSRLTALAGSKAIRTPVERVRDRASVCEGLRAAPGGVDLYEVPEPVLEPRSVVAVLARRATELGVRVLIGEAEVVEGGAGVRMTTGGDVVRAAAIVLCAGAANAALIAEAGKAASASEGSIGTSPRMQTRPLHMVIASGTLPEIYGHCVAGLSDKPRVTIGTQDDGLRPGRRVWYIGGQVAEAGVSRGREEQIAAARAELAACVPWVDLADTEWATLRIDRAEGLTERGERPDEPVISEVPSAAGRVLAVWPTKLAFAPLVAERVEALLAGGGDERPVADGAGAGNVGAAHRKVAATGSERVDAPVAPLPWERSGVEWTR